MTAPSSLALGAGGVPEPGAGAGAAPDFRVTALAGRERHPLFARPFESEIEEG